MDMDVDYDTLLIVDNKLDKISYSLMNSAQQMQTAIRNSQDFLSGQQFEKAKNITFECTQYTELTAQNLIYAKTFIEELLVLLDEYGQCEYGG